MKTFIGNLPKKSRSGYSTENELFTKYLSKNSFRGFYYDSNNITFGLSLYFPPEHDNKLTLCALESDSNYSINEFKMNAKSFMVESIAYDKVMISINEYQIEERKAREVEKSMQGKPEFILQVLSRNSIFIYFPNSEMYGSPIKSLKGGLVLSRETEQVTNQKTEETINVDSFFHV